MLACWSVAGSARGQMPYPGMVPAYGPMPAPGPAMYQPRPPMPGYGAPPGYPYPYYPPAPYPPAWTPQPTTAYYPPSYQQPLVAGPYNPYPVSPKTVTANSAPACACKPAADCAACEPLVSPPPAPPPMGSDGTETKARDRLLGLSMTPFWVCCEKVRTCFDRPPPPVAPCGYPWYGRSEVLYFWMPGQSIPGSTNLGSTGSSIAVPGFSSVSLNSVIPYYNDIIAASHLGGRLTLGRWLDEDQYWGVEATIWSAYQAPQPIYSSGGPATAASAAQISSISSLLGIGEAQAKALLKTFSGKNTVGTITGIGSGELNLRHEFCRSPNGHVDILLGFRAFDLSDAMAVINTQDVVLVTTQNVFLGGQIGVEGEFNIHRLFIDGWGKFALGNNHEVASAGSNSTATGTVSSFSSFASNQGSASRNEFTGLGEAGLAAGFQLGSHARVFASYTIVYLNNAARPSSQINNFLGTSPSGTFSFGNGSFWAQGVGAGLEFRF